MAITRFRTCVFALIFALGSFIGAVSPAVVSAAPLPPPECRYDDVLTTPREYTDWNITLLDTIYMVPKSYVPPGLVWVGQAGVKGSGQVRRFVIEDLTAMATAARQAGGPLRVVSAYRSYATQARTFQREAERNGMYEAKHSVARPGHSEHQLGVTIDFGAASAPGVVSQKFASTTAGKWMKANAWQYGWIMSYPRNRTGKTCYFSEPWHFRYVGKDMAQQVHDSGLTLREYLWKHYQ